MSKNRQINFRRPQTGNSLRVENQEDQIKVKNRLVPTEWDDLPRSFQRSWKVQRKTRWHRIKTYLTDAS